MNLPMVLHLVWWSPHQMRDDQPDHHAFLAQPVTPRGTVARTLAVTGARTPVRAAAS